MDIHILNIILVKYGKMRIILEYFPKVSFKLINFPHHAIRSRNHAIK